VVLLAPFHVFTVVPDLVRREGLRVDFGIYAKFPRRILIGSHSPLDSKMSPDLPSGTGKSIGGDLDVDDEGSEQRRFEPVQSLHHDSVGYQLVHTRIGLAKKAMSLVANQEHKQE
jgi:hypothetical protein